MPDTALVLLHGALGAGDQLAALQGALDGLGAPILAPDLPGHGRRADDPAPLAIPRFADAVRADLAAAGCARAVLFGYSMGGCVALHLAAHAPDVVRGVGTLGTKLAWAPAVAEHESRQLDAAAIRAKVPRFAELLARRHGEARWEGLLGRTAALLRDLGERPPLGDADFARIRGPTRLAVGDRDATVTLDETRDAARRIDGAELEVLPGTPHPLERASLARVALGVRELWARAGD